MNILIDAHVFDDKHQGSRTYLKGLYSALIKQSPHWNFFMAAKSTENLKLEFGEHENLTLLALKSNNKFYRLLVELPSLIKKFSIDYTHFQYTIPPFKRGKYIVTIHDILFEQPELQHYFPLKGRIVNHILHKFAAKKADVLLTVSDFSKQKLADIYNIPRHKIFVTPNAIGSEFNNPTISSPPIKEKYILYVSRIEPRKNHLSLLKAYMENELYKDYKLIFIGKKDIFYKELEDYIEENSKSISNNLICLEGLTTQELISYYRHCSLFVFPSYAEGFGIPPLEAMSLGCKLLCSKNTAMADFDLPDSLFFDPYNIEELKQKMMFQLKSDHIFTMEYQQILKKYSWENIATNFHDLLLSHFKNS